MSDSHHETYLDVFSTAGVSSRFLLKDDTAVIGRDPKVEVHLDSKSISRRHAEMSRDELGRWSVRDLGSRNGTYVNGERLSASQDELAWHVLEPGDRIEITGFSLTLMISTPAIEQAMDHELSFINEGGADEPVQTLQNAAATQIAPQVLMHVGQIGMHLVQVAQPRDRLEALARELLTDVMHAQAVMALRLSKEPITDPPRTLMKPAYHEDWPQGQPLHISRTLLRAALARHEPVLALPPSGEPDAGMPSDTDSDVAAVEMSIAPGSTASSWAVLACPLQSTPAHLDLIYVAVDPEFGTTDWLALTALAAKQYEIACAAHALANR